MENSFMTYCKPGVIMDQCDSKLKLLSDFQGSFMSRISRKCVH